MTDAERVAEIAGKLTPMQKRSLTSEAIRDGNQWWVGGSNHNLANLRKKGLARGMGRFTCLGMDVRAHLEATHD